MACVFEGNITFVNAPVPLPPGTIFSGDYENYSILINSGDDSYKLEFIGKIGTQGIVYAAGGSLGAPVFPAVSVIVANEQYLISYGENSLSETTAGTFYISICEKESDSDACPDVPLADSIPEKYADYIDENGNFVPKESSGGGGGDCDFTIATLRIVDKNGEQLSSEMPRVLGSAAFIYQNMLVVSNAFPFMFLDYQVPLYKGSLLLNLNSANIVSISGDIESSAEGYRIFGDSTIAVESDNIT